MCMLSVVTDYGRRTWPVDSYVGGITPPLPIVIEKPVERVPTQEEWDEFLEICDKAKKWDELMGEADCVDPGKDAWMEEIERRLKAVEERNPFSFTVPATTGVVSNQGLHESPLGHSYDRY